MPILLLLIFSVWIRVRRFFGWVPPGGQTQSGVSPIAFYNRLETAAAQADLSRESSQTPREFAEELVGWLRNMAVGNEDIDALKSLIDAFYESRFGGRLLDSDESEAIEHALLRLEQAFAPEKAAVATRHV